MVPGSASAEVLVIRLQVLGPLQIVDSGGRDVPSVLAQPKRLAVLVHLALAPGFRRRDRLLAMFWPDLDSSHARGSLSQSIRFLRRELGSPGGQVITSRGPEELGVNRAMLWCDAVAFSELLAAGEYGDALELYRGDLLEGFFIQGGQAFEEWLERERDALRAGAAKAARSLAEQREASGHFTTAVASARRAIELSHPDERAMRELLELLDRLGDRAGAMHAYEVFAQRVARELDAAPSAETLALIERIRSGRPPPEHRPVGPEAALEAKPVSTTVARTIDRWRVERELARGGTATVFLARDTRHDRPVALKALSLELMTAGAADRFVREIRITASLAHPHILPLIDAGAADGVPYLVTPYIGGETLRGRLHRETTLDVAEALRLVREIADAVDYAHRRGVIHRDIKPENVLLADGHALVADFGIANAAAGMADAGDAATANDAVAGSLAYMSPEQAAGATCADARSDLYSIGCVLHELLTGTLPRVGDSAREIRRRRTQMPAAVAQLISDCIARDPDGRPPSAAAVGRALDAALSGDSRAGDPLAPGIPAERDVAPAAKGARLFRGRRVTALAAAALVMFTGIGYVAAGAAGDGDRPRVVVLPFRNVTADPALEYLGFAVAESIAVALSEVPTVEAVPIGDPGAARRYSVAGAFRQVGDSLEFAITLVDDARGRTLPAPGPVRVASASPLAAADAIRHRAMGALAYYTSVFGIDDTPQRRPPSWDAYVAFADGLAARLRSDWTGSETAFRRAIALDSSYTEAYFLLASTFINQHGNASARGGLVGRFDAIDSLGRAMHAALPSLRSPDRSVVDFMERYAAGDLDGALDASIRTGERLPAANFTTGFMGVVANRPRAAIAGLARLDPDEGWTREWSPYWVQLTAALHQAQQYDDELREALRGRRRHARRVLLLTAELRAKIALGRVDELSMQDLPPLAILRLAQELRAHGHVERSNEWMNALVSRDSVGDAPFPDRIWVSMALVALGRLDEATAMIERSVQLDPLALDQRGLLGTVYALQSRRDDAMRISRELASVDEPYLQGLPTLWRAKIAARLGDRDTAVDLLARAFDEGVMHHPGYPAQRGSFWHSDPDFESLRGYDRYDDLVRAR